MGASLVIFPFLYLLVNTALSCNGSEKQKFWAFRALTGVLAGHQKCCCVIFCGVFRLSYVFFIRFHIICVQCFHKEQPTQTKTKVKQIRDVWFFHEIPEKKSCNRIRLRYYWQHMIGSSDSSVDFSNLWYASGLPTLISLRAHCFSGWQRQESLALHETDGHMKRRQKASGWFS